MSNEISNWLNSSQNYNDGLALFGANSRNVSLLRILTNGGETRRNKETLAYELGKIAKSAGVVLQPKKEVIVVKEPKKTPLKKKKSSKKSKFKGQMKGASNKKSSTSK